MFHVEPSVTDRVMFLFDERRPRWAENRLGQEWWIFHRTYPDVAAALARLARQLIRKGHDRLGIAMLWETLRYESMLRNRPDEPGPRLPNNHRAYYARWLMEKHEDLRGVFDVRPVRVADRDAM